MALTSIQTDFIVKNGIVIQSTGAVTSSTGQIGSLQANSGAAIAKNLIVGTTATIYGSATFYNNIYQPSLSTGGIIFADSTGKYSQDGGLSYNAAGSQLSVNNITGGVVTATSHLYVTGTDGTTSAGTGALQITGGAGIGGGLYVANSVTATNFYGNIYANNTSSMVVGFASTAGYALNFNTGTLVTTAVTIANTSGFVVGFASTAGYALNFNTGTLVTTAVTVADTSSFYAGYANEANNLLGGAANQIPYQSGANATTFSSNFTFNGSSLSVTTGAFNTSTGANNSLYVTGGSWFSTATFSGPVTFSQPVTFSGAATYVYSTNTVYTDNIIELHVPPTGIGTQWQSDDGKDIGLRFHYYANSTDTNAALVLADDTKYLEWYQTGSENLSGDFTGPSSYGVIKAGIMFANSNTNATTYPVGSHFITANAGAIQTLGGIGVAQDIYAGGNVTATGFYGNVYATNTSSIQVGYAANILGGAAGSIFYQSGANTTALLPAGTNGYILEMVSGLPAWAPISGLTAGTASTATNIAGGTAGQTPYQTAPGTTSFYGPGTAGQLLVSGGTSGPTYTNTGSIYVGYANEANNILAGSTGQIPYQTAANATGFDSGLVYSTSNNGTLTIGGQIIVNGTNAANSSASNGSLQVAGGVGIGKDLYVSTTATINGNLYVGGTIYMQGVGLDTISSNTGTFVDVVSTGTITANNIVLTSTGTFGITSTLDYGVSPGTTATNKYYSFATKGGIKAAKNIIAGGVVSAGDFGSTGANDPLSTDSGSRDGFYLLNNMQSARTISSVSGAVTVTIDSWSKNTYSSAKYIVQAVDGSNVFAAELMIIQDGTNVYLSEYGIVYNNSVLGTFDGTITGNNVVVSFTAVSASNMTIQVVRQSILTAAESYAS